MKYKAVRGMEDILPGDIPFWQHLERIAHEDLKSWGYNEIRTPIVEDTAIFVRSIGETSDIVTKEMYTFNDRKGRSLTLRPEGTAPIVRAYVEHSLYNISPELKLYYIGPMFRSEKPQKGRSRQFHQIGVEVIGSGSAYVDAEIITQLHNMLDLFGLKGFTIKLNSLGCARDKAEFTGKLKEYLMSKKSRLCTDCKERIKKNVLRTLDCKKESCIQALKEAPNILDSLCDICSTHFYTVKTELNKRQIRFQETKNLVRGLDYYTGTVFEITHPDLGSQDAIGAGGRYDNLVKSLGGPEVGAVGYAIGMERVIIALKKQKWQIPSNVIPIVYVASVSDWERLDAIRVAEKIRRELRIITLTSIKDKASLKWQMNDANRKNAKFVIILGEDELKKGKATIRDMAKQEQTSVDLDNVVSEVKKRIGI